jgi:hypothetical protein
MIIDLFGNKIKNHGRMDSLAEFPKRRNGAVPCPYRKSNPNIVMV